MQYQGLFNRNILPQAEKVNTKTKFNLNYMNKEELRNKFAEMLKKRHESEELRLSKMTLEEIELERKIERENREIKYWEEFHKEFNEKKLNPILGFDRLNCFETTKDDIRDTLNSQNQFLSLQDYYPIISKINGISTPKTQFITIENGAIFWALIRLGSSGKCIDDVINYIENSIKDNAIQFPCFFKLATRSLKHALYGECMIFKTKEEFMSSLPTIGGGMFANYDNDRYVSNTFCFRELLDIDYSVNNYGQMPLINEYRTFIKDGKITAFMPYYSYESFAKNFLGYDEKRPEKHEECRIAYDKIVKLTEEDKNEIERISLEISKVIPAHHSLDIMQDLQGKWWVVDMQPAQMSSGYEKTFN